MTFTDAAAQSRTMSRAWGDLVAGFRNEFAQTLIRITSETSDEELRSILGELEARAREWMDGEGIAPESQHVERPAFSNHSSAGTNAAGNCGLD